MYFKTDEDLTRCIEKSKGKIMVNPYGQVSSSVTFDPYAENQPQNAEDVFRQNIFSFGSVCLTQANEYKNYTSMKKYSAEVANNIIIMALGNEVKHNLKKL